MAALARDNYLDPEYSKFWEAFFPDAIRNDNEGRGQVHDVFRRSNAILSDDEALH